MICSLVLAFIVLTIIIFIVLLNIIIAQKRKYVYNQTIKSKKLYEEGIRKLNQLLKFPQTRLNLSNTMLFIAYTKMFQLKFSEALENFDELKEFDVLFKVGIRNSALASYYKILIYFYINDEGNLKKELQYFNDLYKITNKKPFKYLIKCVDAIEKNNLEEIIQSLKCQKNPFAELIIRKIS